MQWMETVRLRAGRDVGGELLHRLADFETDLGRLPGLVSWHVYRHASLPGDFAVTLHWRTAGAESSGSAPADRLARCLSAFGLIDHTVWIGCG